MVTYEWDIESYDGDEIVDHNFGDNLKDIGLPVLQGDQLVLVRNDDDGRYWAYVEANMLPAFFSIPQADGKYYETTIKVPKKFHRELAKEVGR